MVPAWGVVINQCDAIQHEADEPIRITFNDNHQGNQIKSGKIYIIIVIREYMHKVHPSLCRESAIQAQNKRYLPPPKASKILIP